MTTAHHVRDYSSILLYPRTKRLKDNVTLVFDRQKPGCHDNRSHIIMFEIAIRFYYTLVHGTGWTTWRRDLMWNWQPDCHDNHSHRDTSSYLLSPGTNARWTTWIAIWGHDPSGCHDNNTAQSRYLSNFIISWYWIRGGKRNVILKCK